MDVDINFNSLVKIRRGRVLSIVFCGVVLEIGCGERSGHIIELRIELIHSYGRVIQHPADVAVHRAGSGKAAVLLLQDWHASGLLHCPSGYVL
jgi:hypothetical protein